MHMIFTWWILFPNDVHSNTIGSTTGYPIHTHEALVVAPKTVEKPVR